MVKQLLICGIFDQMNYLAHAYLSFNDPGILLGNMISDYVKGKKQYDYPDRIQAGIRLHRAIDNFTDTHDATRRLKSFYSPVYRLYSGAFADITYDYFLANDTDQFATEQQLMQFTLATYASLENMKGYFPPSFERMFPYMQTHNWLYHYRFEDGIGKSFGGLVRRSAYLQESDRAYDIFLEHKKDMRECYTEFFPSLKIFAAGQFAALLNN